MTAGSDEFAARQGARMNTLPVENTFRRLGKLTNIAPGAPSERSTRHLTAFHRAGCRQKRALRQKICPQETQLPLRLRSTAETVRPHT